MKNNNQSKQQLGLVDSPAFSTDDTENFLHQDELRALENTFPSGKPLKDKTNITQDPSYIYTNNITETWEQFEARTEQGRQRGGVGNMKLTSSGIPSLVNDGVKPTAEQIEKLRKEESINQLSQRLALLQNSEQRLKKELERNLLVQREIKKNLDETTAY